MFRHSGFWGSVYIYSHSLSLVKLAMPLIMKCLKVLWDGLRKIIQEVTILQEPAAVYNSWGRGLNLSEKRKNV